MDGLKNRRKKQWEIRNRKCWSEKQDYINTYVGGDMTDFYKGLGIVKIKEG